MGSRREGGDDRKERMGYRDEREEMMYLRRVALVAAAGAIACCPHLAAVTCCRSPFQPARCCSLLLGDGRRSLLVATQLWDLLVPHHPPMFIIFSNGPLQFKWVLVSGPLSIRVQQVNRIYNVSSCYIGNYVCLFNFILFYIANIVSLVKVNVSVNFLYEFIFSKYITQFNLILL